MLLIAAQCHEATRVAGFNAWRKLSRFVRKGEKAIWILAPMIYKNTDAEKGEDERVIRGLKFVPVFDVAQTDGEELPSICKRLDDDDPAGHYAQLLRVAQSVPEPRQLTPDRRQRGSGRRSQTAAPHAEQNRRFAAVAQLFTQETTIVAVGVCTVPAAMVVCVPPVQVEAPETEP